MRNSLATLLLLHLTLFGISQDIGYDVRGVYMRPIVKEKIKAAKTVGDINPGYPSSWISHYLSVELMVTCNGILLKAVSANDTLNDEQLSILEMADIGTDVVVDVKYNRANPLNDDLELRVINFTYTVVPDVEAEYPGGYQLLKDYFKESAIDKIPEAIAGQFQGATVRFTINEEGEVVDAQLLKTSEDEATDTLLLEAVNNMSKWKPAENDDGTKVRQEFEFVVGNFDDC